MKRTLLLLLVPLLTAGSARGETWSLNANGAWSVAANWAPATVPNGIGDSAFFGNVITADRTITQNFVSVTLGQLTFSDDNNYTIAGNPIIMNGAGSVALGVLNSSSTGDHTISADLQIIDALSLVNAGTGRLTLSGLLSGTTSISMFGGGTIRLSGADANTHSGTFSLTDGILELAKNGGLNALSGSLRVAGNSSRANWINSGQLPSDANVSVLDLGILDFNSVSESFGTLDVGETGRLFDIGALTISEMLNNSGTITLSTGSTIAMSGAAPFDNFGRLVLAGGDVGTGVTGQLNNLGLLEVTSGGGIFGTGAWINSGLARIDSLLTLSATGAHVNSGNIEISAPGRLSLGIAADLSNEGAIQLAGGAIRGAVTLLTNSGPASIISGHGEITSQFVNSEGTLRPEGGTLRVTDAFPNSGIVRPVGGASLVGGVITNTGLITGDGAIANDINNNAGGRIESAGLLILGGAVANPAGGLISAPANTRLIVTHGLPSNQGIISPSGGTIDNNGHPLNNSGQISGYGTLLTGGLTNAGAITLVGGTSIVHGSVTNNALKKIEVRYSDALFTGAVTNNGIFKTTGATTTFTGTYTENGVFNSDPSNNYFADVFLNAPGQWNGGAGDNFFVKGVLNWSGGGMIGAGGTTYAQATSLLSGPSDKTISGWVFRNETPLTLSGTGAVQMANDAVFRNLSVADIQSDADFHSPGPSGAAFVDSGVLRKSGGAGISQIGPDVQYLTNGSTIDVHSGTIDLAGPISINIGATLTKTGAATLSLSGSQSHGAGATFAATAGTTNFNSDAGGNLQLQASGAATTVHLNTHQHLASLSAAGGSVVDLKSSANNPPYYAAGDKHVVTGSLAIGIGSKLDLHDGALVINAGAAAVEPLLQRGFGSGVWDGDGLTSSTAQNDPLGLTGLGMLRNPDASIYDRVSGSQFNFGGGGELLPSTPDQVLVKFTYVGDTDLNGRVDGDDLVSFLVGFNNHFSGWELGDFDYSGTVDGDDLVSLLVSYANQGAVLSTAGGVVAVPEPSAMVLAILGGLGIGLALARRR